MQDPVVDLRSDILTRPTEAMIAAMGEAARSPGAFGLREDPRVQALERQVAALLGKEDALFCPTCTQANQIAIHLHCRAGDLLVAESDSHVFTSEAGGAAALTGVMPRPVSGERGVMSTEALRVALEPGDALRSPAGVVVIENTHVRSGGCVVPAKVMTSQCGLAEAASVPVHLDGARLANAALAEDVSMQSLAAGADSVSLSLNKGLGAPLGAMLAGNRAFITGAERTRQRFGGGWRPIGIPAAAALVALDGWEARLANDHHRAKQLAGSLAALSMVQIDTQSVQTNLVLAGVQGLSAHQLTDALATQGVLVLPYNRDQVRLALYHDINDGHAERVVDAFQKVTQSRVQH